MIKAFSYSVLALMLTSAAYAGDVDEGRKLSQTCVACHGSDGKTPSVPGYPKLAGQYAEYLEKALTDYKTGERKNAIMAGMAQPLSKTDIQNLAAYYASLKGDLTHNK